MTKRLVQISLMAALLVVAFSAGFRSSAHLTQEVLDYGQTNETGADYQPYICPDTGNTEVVCTDYITDACVCYNNGTCVNTQANKCSTCQGEDVVSVTEGVTCAEDQIDGTPVRCRPSQFTGGILNCPLAGPACLCYTNGTCVQGYGNNCTECGSGDVAYLVEDGECPPEGIQAATQVGSTNSEETTEDDNDAITGAVLLEQETVENSNPFQYFVCPDRDPAVTTCTTDLQDACVCYNNNTCNNTQANACNTCFDDDVISVNVGDQCPTDTLNGTWTRCITVADIQINCLANVTTGCLCFGNGTCVEGDVNPCIDCQRDEVALVIENGQCPENGIYDIEGNAA